MNRFLYLLLISILISCDNVTEIQKDGITYHFTDNISDTRRTAIFTYISEEIKDTKFETIRNLTDIKVDSVPFSIVLYIPFEDSITNKKRNDFKVFANFLTHFSFDSVPVNVVLTDHKFRVRESIPSDMRIVTWGGERMVQGRVEIRSTIAADRFSKEILNEILRTKMPELYKGDDSVKISLDVVKDTVMVEFNINPKINNVDTLRSQFRKTDMLFFAFTFEKKTVLFHLRDKDTKELLTVFGVRGE